MCRSSGRCAFTLIELLVTISIVAVLSSIAMAVFSKGTESAKKVACVSNLRQIGAAMHTYAGENNGLFPPGYGSDNLVYAIHLLPYIGQTGDNNSKGNVFLCPSNSLPMTAAPSDQRMLITYAVHGRLCADTTQGDTRYRLANVTRPSQTILAADATQMPYNANLSNATIYAPYEEFDSSSSLPLDSPIPTWTDVDQSYGGGAIRYRHNGGANAVMVDGHVQFFHKGEVTYANASVDR